MINLFHNIEGKNQEKLLYTLEATRLKFSKNEYILDKITEKNIVGLVITGSLQIIKTDYSGNRTIIDELKPADIFGSDISPLRGNEYEIFTKEESVIYIIDFDSILNLSLDRHYHQQFMKNLLEIMNEKMKMKNERIEILTKKSIRNKLLEYFNIESNNVGKREFILPFNFTELADFLAIDRSAMSREIKYLKEDGLIVVKGKRITLLYDKY